MLSSLMGLPNPAWVSLGNVVSHMADDAIPADVRFRVLYSSGKKSQHASSTDAIRQSMCDICFCISWPENHNMHHRTSTDSPVDVRYLLFYLLTRKSQHASSHTVDVRYMLLYLLARKSQHASSHIDRFDSPVDVRYLLLYLLATTIVVHNFGTIVKRQVCQKGDEWHTPGVYSILERGELHQKRGFASTSKRRSERSVRSVRSVRSSKRLVWGIMLAMLTANQTTHASETCVITNG
jgi:hypothetical protein